MKGFATLFVLLVTLSNPRSTSIAKECIQSDQVCVLPSEQAMCDKGWLELCESAVCYDSDGLCSELAPEEFGFFLLCSVFTFSSEFVNCRRGGDVSGRKCAVDCYEGNGIDVAAISRGQCEPGGCCDPPLPLCELERYFHFMSLGYGISAGSTWTNSKIDSSIGFTTFLGRLSRLSSSTQRTLSVPSSADNLTAQFDLYEIDMFEDAETFASIYVSGVKIPVGPFATNNDEASMDFEVDGIHVKIQSQNPPMQIGFGDARDLVHHVTMSVPHEFITSGELYLRFTLDHGSSSVSSESMGIDNINITGHFSCSSCVPQVLVLFEDFESDWKDPPCSSSFDSFGTDEEHKCVSLTDGKSNDAVVCENAGITSDEEGRSYCDISFAGTNDVIDILIEGLSFSPTQATTRVYGTENSTISFTPFENLRRLAEGDPTDETDGILDIAFHTAWEKGCFTRQNAAVHLMGHSLAAAIANLFALKLAALFPDVHVKMTTMGEPTLFFKPLTGLAASIQAWSNKDQYINGRVLPRGKILDGLYPLLRPRDYGVYQNYCPIAQLIPGGYFGGNEKTRILFMCEVLGSGNELSYFVAGREGCAAGRDDILNDLPSFPHKGLLYEKAGDRFISAFLLLLRIALKISGIKFEADSVLDLLNIVLTLPDLDLQEDFFQVLDLHFIRRSTHMLRLLYSDGQNCEAVRRTIPLSSIGS